MGITQSHAVFTRHSLVRAKGEVFVLLYVCLFVCLFGQRFLDNPRADSRHILHAGVAWVGTCLLPFWGLAAPGGRKKRQMEFSLLWSQWGFFCILAVFERYLGNACTDPHHLYTDNVCPRAPSPCGIHWPLGAGEGELKTQKIGGGLIRAADSYNFLFFSAIPNVIQYVGHRPAHILV